MENSGEFSQPIETIVQTNRQESLDKQLKTLDEDRKDHQVLARFLTQLYDHERYSVLDKGFSEKKNVRYQPKSALDGNLTKAPFGDFYGIYEYQPIADAVDSVDDPFNIFPSIEEVFKQSGGKENREIVFEIAKTITEKTDVPVYFEEPIDEITGTNWGLSKDGKLFSKSITSNNAGIHVYMYQSSPEILSDIEKKGYSENMDFKPVGDAIIINKSLIDKPQVIQTCLHELGHIVEDRFIMPQKEEEYKDKPFMNTEIISSLYGLKASLLMAEHNPDIAVQMMISPVTIYNWALTGTTAP